MASRAEEKERRRRERQAQEAEAARATARARRLRLGLAGAVVAAAAIALVVAVVSGGDSSKPAGGGGAGVAIPARKVTDLATAARAAGCTVRSYPQANRFRSHTTAKVAYKTNPPTFGNHNPTPASDGDYSGQGAPPKEQLVHSLEHGRIQIQYRPGTPRREVGQLATLFNESVGSYGGGEYLQLFENPTNMPYAVAATAWGHLLACPRFDPGVFDAIRAFRETYTLKAPEYIPQPE